MLSAAKVTGMQENVLPENSWIIPRNRDAESIAEASLLRELGLPWHGPIP